MRRTQHHIEIESRLRNTTKPLNVIELLRGTTMNKTTVYRQLEKMVTFGLVNLVLFEDGQKRYELSSLKHHHHVICDKCGAVQDVILNEDQMFKNLLSKYKVSRHSIELFGLCKGCQNN